MRLIITCICLLLSSPFQGHTQTFTSLIKDAKASFRGLSTYKNNIIWVSGSQGKVGKSNDKGKNWEWVSPAGYEKFDFRDIHVFSPKQVLIVSAGSPGIILLTKDAGKSWKEVYRDSRPEIFLNGMDFHGKMGYVLGDPIDGTFQLLKSKDKGENWTDESLNILLFAEPGEAGFAASGSSIQVINDWVYIGSGGSYSSLYKRNEREKILNVVDVPILSGNSSSGIFSIDFLNERTGIVVGGDYMSENNNSNNILLTYNGGLSWVKPTSPVLGYRSSIKYINELTVLATGTTGTDLSYDGGVNWKNISTESFNVIAVSKNHKHIYLAGSNGNISCLDLP